MLSPSARQIKIFDFTKLDGLALALGVATGLGGAVAYYNTLLRPVSHTFILWIIAVIAVCAGQALHDAIRRAFLVLVGGVCAFYTGQQLVYSLKYPSSRSLNVDSIIIYCILAIGAAAVLGSVFHFIGTRGWTGSFATAAAIGLLVGDTVRRTANYPADRPVVFTMMALGIGSIGLWTSRRLRDLVATALLVPFMTLLGVIVIVGPDFIESLLVG